MNLYKFIVIINYVRNEKTFIFLLNMCKTYVRGTREERTMLITRECDYAVRVIRALSGADRLSVGEICEKEDITAPFAYKILKKLQKAEIVRGFRGVHGGYSMNKNASDVTLFDIYTAIDPELMIIECMDSQYQCVRDGHDGSICMVHRELADIQQELWKLLRRKSLKELF